MEFLKKYWPTISAVAGGLLTFLLPALTAYVSEHPKSSIGVLLSCVIAAYHATAPKDKPEPGPSTAVALTPAGAAPLGNLSAAQKDAAADYLVSNDKGKL